MFNRPTTHPPAAALPGKERQKTMHYEYQVEQCQSGQWRYTIFEVVRTDRIEIEGGAGFESEAEAIEAACDSVGGYVGRHDEVFDVRDLR